MQLFDSRLPERFWDKVIPEPNSGCWLWDAAYCHGYGYFSVGGGANEFAHRVTASIVLGPIPAGLVVDHKCTTPACCNPYHLQIVTSGRNVALVYERNRRCHKGHIFEIEDLHVYIYPSGKALRRCPHCRADLLARRVIQKRDQRRQPVQAKEFVACRCGCGQMIPSRGWNGRARYFVLGHSNRTPAK